MSYISKNYYKEILELYYFENLNGLEKRNSVNYTLAHYLTLKIRSAFTKLTSIYI